MGMLQMTAQSSGNGFLIWQVIIGKRFLHLFRSRSDAFRHTVNVCVAKCIILCQMQAAYASMQAASSTLELHQLQCMMLLSKPYPTRTQQ